MFTLHTHLPPWSWLWVLVEWAHKSLCVWCVYSALTPCSWCYPVTEAAVLCPSTCEPAQCSVPGVSHILTYMHTSSGCPKRPPQFPQGGRYSGPGCPPCLSDQVGFSSHNNQAYFSLGAQSFGNLNIMKFPPHTHTRCDSGAVYLLITALSSSCRISSCITCTEVFISHHL